MYCGKCGKELRNGDPYCSNCGAKVGGRGGSDLRSAFSSLVSSVTGTDPFAMLGDAKPVFFISLVCQILCCILIGMEMLTVKVDLYFFAESARIGLFDDRGLLSFLAHVGYIVSAAALLLPVFRKTVWGKMELLPAVIMPLLGLLLFVICVVRGSGALGDYEDLANVSISLTGAGWMFLITSVAAVLVSWMGMKKIPAEQEYQSQRIAEDRMCDTRNAMAKADHVRCRKCGHVQKAGIPCCEICFETF